MDLAGVLPYITGAGGALVVLALWVTALGTGKQIPEKTHNEIVSGKDAQIRDLTAAVASERQRSDAAVTAAQTTLGIVAAIRKEASSP